MRELARLPGVLAAEPVRAVPVRVRSGAMVRTVALTGLSEDGASHRLVDRDGAVYRTPPGGAVLTAEFAQRLGVGRGDSLRLELLERGGAVRTVEVVALVDELFGNTIHMKLGALARLIGEAPRASGA